jgi:hypothetical protein
MKAATTAPPEKDVSSQRQRKVGSVDRQSKPPPGPPFLVACRLCKQGLHIPATESGHGGVESG